MRGSEILHTLTKGFRLSIRCYEDLGFIRIKLICNLFKEKVL